MPCRENRDQEKRTKNRSSRDPEKGGKHRTEGTFLALSFPLSNSKDRQARSLSWLRHLPPSFTNSNRVPSREPQRWKHGTDCPKLLSKLYTCLMESTRSGPPPQHKVNPIETFKKQRVVQESSAAGRAPGHQATLCRGPDARSASHSMRHPPPPVARVPAHQ